MLYPPFLEFGKAKTLIHHNKLIPVRRQNLKAVHTIFCYIKLKLL